jgi:bifunctional DNase/RNase
MDDFIRAIVKGVYIVNTINGPTPMVLISDEERKIMPIYVGMPEGISINSALNNEVTPRPMTHDLMINSIESLGARISDVYIDEIQNGTYYARLALTYNGSVMEIDARPSDCISLAIRVDAPIKVRRSVFESSLITEDELEGIMTLNSFL